MRFDACIDAAVKAGEIDAERAAAVKADYLDQIERYKLGGMNAAEAQIAAGEDVLESFMKRARARRHATLRQLEVMGRNEARYASAHEKDPDIVLKDLEWTEAEFHGLERQFMGGIRDFLETHRTNIIGQVRDRAQLMEVTRELHGEASGNAAAKEVADAIKAQYERARTLANANGMDIGKLEDFGVPHSHDADKIEQAGFEQWSRDVWERVDWHRIENFATGKPFSFKSGVKPFYDDVRPFLEDIYRGIVTRGWDNRAPSMGMGARALKNSRNAHRVLHFKSADDWMAYNELFGRENPFEGVISHLRGMARDIAMMRSFGPNPKAGLEHAIQVIERDTSTIGGEAGRKASAVARRKAAKARVMLRILSGEANQPADHAMATLLAGTRNLLTAAQLGSASLSQVTDVVSMRIAAKAIALNPNAPIKTMIEISTKGLDRQMAKDLGYVFDTWFDTGAAQARFMGDIWSPELTERISNAVLRGNGMAFLTDRERVAVSMAFGSDLADRAGRSFDALEPELRTFMENRGISARDWDALRSPEAIYTDPRGGKHLNPNWFLEHTTLDRAEAEDIAIRWSGLWQAHQEYAIPSSSLRGRATFLGNSAPGSFLGEGARSSIMYKSYSLSVLFNQIRRVREMQGFWTKATYATAWVAQMTLMGALAVQLKEIAKGRDPRPMDDTPFWMAAFMQGGGVGIFGDFFASETSRAGGGLAETLMGPVVGVAGDLTRAVASNAARISEGKAPLLGRDVVKIARRYNPAATFQPLLPIPTRVALDRMLWDQIQPFLDPEADKQFRQYEKRLERTWRTTSWWERGSFLPERSPDLNNALGGAQ